MSRLPLSTPIEDLRLNNRSKGLLKTKGYQTLRDICESSELELLRIKGLGLASLNNIRDAVKSAGYAISMGTAGQTVKYLR